MINWQRITVFHRISKTVKCSTQVWVHSFELDLTWNETNKIIINKLQNKHHMLFLRFFLKECFNTKRPTWPCLTYIETHMTLSYLHRDPHDPVLLTETHMTLPYLHRDSHDPVLLTETHMTLSYLHRDPHDLVLLRDPHDLVLLT